MNDDEYGDDDESLPYVRSSATSAGAADDPDVKANAARLRPEIYAFVLGRGAHGATRDEVEAGLDLRHQTGSPRVREPVLMGCLIEHKGVKRKTRGGCAAVVCTAVAGADPTGSAPPYDGVQNALDRVLHYVRAGEITLEQAIARLRAGCAAPATDDGDDDDDTLDGDWGIDP